MSLAGHFKLRRKLVPRPKDRNASGLVGMGWKARVARVWARREWWSQREPPVW